MHGGLPEVPACTEGLLRLAACVQQHEGAGLDDGGGAEHAGGRDGDVGED